MTWLSGLLSGIGEFFGWMKAREQNKVNPVLVRKADQAAVADAQNAARLELAKGDEQAIPVTIANVLAPAPDVTVPGYAEQAAKAKNELEAGDMKAVTTTIGNVLAITMLLALTAGCVTASVPQLQPVATWEAKALTIDGVDGIWVPKAIFSRIEDCLIYLKSLETQGRIKQ